MGGMDKEVMHFKGALKYCVWSTTFGGREEERVNLWLIYKWERKEKCMGVSYRRGRKTSRNTRDSIMM